ncbi:MAG: tRNA (5-methylaminomethyl-2-thiouridine)(34)-methyltransferase MnmD [Lysobacterales bacterium]
MPSRLTDPHLKIGADGAVRSGLYDDIYFQAEGACEESQQVYVDGCKLTHRWHEAAHFTIAETGFGFGINFLQTWHHWRRHRGPCERLHYVAIEAHPISAATLKPVHQRWPHLQPLCTQLRRHYPALTPGYHRITLGDQVTLTLLLGDVLEMLEQLEASVNGWFLDGFAPSKNPKMWELPVLRQVARLSSSGAGLATFSTAQMVREGLIEAGFTLTRRPGFGNKKECLAGVYEGVPQSGCPQWFVPPPPVSTSQRSSPQITIIGDGVAGQSVASALRLRGLPFRLLGTGAGASTNPSVSVMPRLEAGDAPAGRFFWHAYRYALDYWNRRQEFTPCGALQFARTDAEAERFTRIVQHWDMPQAHLNLLTGEASKSFSGVTRDHVDSALCFPEAGIVKGFARGSVDQIRVTGASYSNEGWQLQTSVGPLQADILVLTTGAQSLPLDTGIALQNWHGMALKVPATERSTSLRCGLFGGKYLHPHAEGAHWAGASFNQSVDATTSDQLAETLLSQYPDLLSPLPPLARWQGWRHATPDRLPAAGPVLDMALAENALAWVRGGPVGRSVPWLPNCYFLGGLGARGFTTAPLLGEWLASMISGDPWPLPRDLALTVASSRFLVRKLKRQQTTI